ncbi:MAG: imelysin family protein [Sneathiella sp.]
MTLRPFATTLALLLMLITNGQVRANEASSSAYEAVIRNTIQSAIIPAYKNLLNKAVEQASALDAFCQSPDDKKLFHIRTAFRELVMAWSAAEIYRLGPATNENRQEKLLFWPDRRGRGLKQVRKLIADQNQDALDPVKLQKKSVAVQGLLALEYVLYGDRSDDITRPQENIFRCSYAASILQVIQENTDNILKGWQDKNGYAALMLKAGPDNPIYKTDKEVIRDLLQKADEMILTIESRKLAPMLRKNREQANHKRAPFWRSNLTLFSIRANLQSVLDFQEKAALKTLLPEEDRGEADALIFEITQSLKTLQLLDKQPSLEATLKSANGYDKLAYLKNPLKGAHVILSDYYPTALSITMGFNSLDGD